MIEFEGPPWCTNTAGRRNGGNIFYGSKEFWSAELRTYEIYMAEREPGPKSPVSGEMSCTSRISSKRSAPEDGIQNGPSETAHYSLLAHWSNRPID